MICAASTICAADEQVYLVETEIEPCAEAPYGLYEETEMCERCYLRDAEGLGQNRQGGIAMSDKLRSSEMLATAKSLRSIRSRLVQIVRQGNWPEGSFGDLSRVLTEGLLLAGSLGAWRATNPVRERQPTWTSGANNETDREEAL